ncbi:MAG: sulfotransferase [Xanthomonadaceae bacterium]|nr:sulfotransferase [Xanthomonadaceae bacterium]
MFDRTAGTWRRLAALETSILNDDLDAVAIDRPIYVAGVARSGTTIITEMLARHPDVTAHRYSDFPNVYTPFWRNWLAERAHRAPARAVERAHKDRLMVTTESPEAVEEVLWMQFFEHLHDPEHDQTLDAATSNPEFEAFYADHIRKLLLVRGKTRYLTKGNYNTTRLEYILKLFPDARFVVPIRNPVNHVASLVKQDRLFEKTGREDPRVVRQLHLSGHFEFGLDKRCINTGDGRAALEIQAAWTAGDSVQGWALYWAGVYGALLKATEKNPRLRDAIHFIRYEDLCRQPEASIAALILHCRLPPEPFAAIGREFAGRLSEPDYYRPGFTPDESAQLRRATGPLTEHFGYES